METLNTWKDLIDSSTGFASPYSASSSEDIFWRTTLGDVFLGLGKRSSAYNVGHEQGESSIRRIRDDDRPIWEHWWAGRNGRIELEDTPPGIEVPEVRNIGSSVTRASTGRRNEERVHWALSLERQSWRCSCCSVRRINTFHLVSHVEGGKKARRGRF